jgi:hypothetical protein
VDPRDVSSKYSDSQPASRSPFPFFPPKEAGARHNSRTGKSLGVSENNNSGEAKREKECRRRENVMVADGEVRFSPSAALCELKKKREGYGFVVENV